jgi:prepilin-type N-terminal cleavage/methylation domain-containing protein
MLNSKIRQSRGFSLIELVIVVVIIGIIAAIAIPRMSRGTTGANDNALIGNLAVLRKAIDLYAAEHNGNFPTVAAITAQLTQFSDETGATSATRTGAFILGPYLRAIPPLTVGAARGGTGIAAAAGTGVGWIYNATDGTIRANTTATEVDAGGRRYDAY